MCVRESLWVCICVYAMGKQNSGSVMMLLAISPFRVAFSEKAAGV